MQSPWVDNIVRPRRVSLTIAMLMVMLAGQGVGQSRFTMRFYAFNSVTPVADSAMLRLGRDPRGTYCVDPFTFTDQGQTFTEFELPPPPPGFDVRSVRIPSRPGAGGCSGAADRTLGVLNDIRGYLSRTQVDTFQINFQPGDLLPMHFSWPSGLGAFCDSAVMKTVGGAVVETANMLTTQSYSPLDLDVLTVRIFMYGAPAANLVSPSNGSIVPPTVTLSWSAMNGATVYHLQVATDSLFTGSMFVNDSTVSGTSRIVSGLAVPVTYYWRVAAGNVLGFGAYSSFRRFITGNVPAAPSLLSPPNGSTGQSTSPTLRWNSSTGAQTYQVQVSTDQNFVSLVFNDSTVTDTTRVVSGLAFSTTYYWHVRGRNGVGPGSYSTPFNFQTQFQPPGPPTLVSPANGQTSTPITLTLTWNPVNGAVTYRVQVSTNSGFTGIVLDDSTLTTTSRSVGPLVNNTQYFWHVNAKNPAGPGAFSTTFNFTTIILPPPAPGLISPPDNATNVSLTPTMTWTAAATAASYHLQIARDSAFALLVVNDSGIVGTSRQIGQQLTSGTLYYWKVRGKNIGGIGPFSSRFKFTTTQAPPAPLLILPEDSATRVSTRPTFVWGLVAAATSYTLQIATEPTFSSPIVNDSTITDTTKTVGLLPYGARLLWRVRSKNLSGPGGFTSPRVFTIMFEPPQAPFFVSPSNGLFNAPVTLPLRWTNMPLATGFHLQVAIDTLMTNLIVDDSTLIDTFKVVNVPPSMANFWRVRAHSSQNIFGPFTYVRRFTTANVPPAIPTPSSPANGDTGVARNVCVRWTGIPGALTYRAQVSLNSSFTQILADDSTLTTASFCPGLLPPLSTCFWRVRSKGYWGSSQYGATYSFTTGTFTPVEEEVERRTPAAFALQQNYPNPFNPSTVIPFDISTSGFVTLKVFDLLGREVRTLVNEEMPAGTHSVQWNGENDNGRSMPSGMYFVQMMATANGKKFSEVRKVMLLK